jgi:Zn-dependent protease
MLGLDPSTLISRIIILVIAFTLHEFSHALVATWLGDDTPQQAGRLTLNPIAHLDLVGTLMLLFAGFGWAKPVPVNPYALRQRSRAGLMLVSLAGPASNLLLAVIAGLIIRFTKMPLYGLSNRFLPTLGQFLLEFTVINITLCLFNLIPLAPLDGEKVLLFFLPPRAAEWFEKFRPYAPMVLLAIVIIGPLVGFDIVGMLIRTPMLALTRWLIGVN